MKIFKKLIALVMAIGMITINCMAYAAAPADSSITLLSPTRPIGEFSVPTRAIDDVVVIKGSAQFYQSGAGATPIQDRAPYIPRHLPTSSCPPA